MEMNKIVVCITLIAILMALSLSGCITQSAATGKVVRQEPKEPIKIAWLGPLTGAVASLGIDNLHGIELAIDDINRQGGINGRQLKLVIEDDEMNPKLTTNAYQKVTTIDKVKVVLSPSYSGLLALAKEADASRTVLINSLDTSEEIAQAGDYVFGIGIYDEGIGYTLAEFAMSELQQKKPKKAAIIYNTEDAFMVLVKDAFTQRYTEQGGKVIITRAYTYETNDFRTILLKIKEQNISTVLVLGYDEAGFILKQARELGLHFTFLGTDTSTSKNFLANAGEAAEGMYFTSWNPERKQYETFLGKFKKKYGEEPQQPLFSAAGYDTVMVVAQAMQVGDSNKAQMPEKIRDALYSIKDMNDGITGNLTMSRDGIVRTVQEEIFQIRAGKFVKV